MKKLLLVATLLIGPALVHGSRLTAQGARSGACAERSPSRRPRPSRLEGTDRPDRPAPSGADTGGLDPAAISSRLADQWPSYSGDLSGKRFSALKLVNTATVKNLSLKWINTLHDRMRSDRHRAGSGRAGGRWRRWRRRRRRARRRWRRRIDHADHRRRPRHRRGEQLRQPRAGRRHPVRRTTSSTRDRRSTSTRSTRATGRSSGTTTGRRAAARRCRRAASACGATTSTSRCTTTGWCASMRRPARRSGGTRSRRTISSTSRPTRRWSPATTSSSARATTSTPRRS